MLLVMIAQPFMPHSCMLGRCHNSKLTYLRVCTYVLLLANDASITMAYTCISSPVDEEDDHQTGVLAIANIRQDMSSIADLGLQSSGSSNSAVPQQRHFPSQAAKQTKWLVDDYNNLSSENNDGSKKKPASPAANKEPQKKPWLLKENLEKCQYKSCPGLSPTSLHPFLVCNQATCTKLIHRLCYERMVQNSSAPCTPLEYQVFRNLSHHDAYLKTQKKPSLTWTTDGANGPNDLKCSLFYLINLLPARCITCSEEIPHGHTQSIKCTKWLQSCFIKMVVTNQLMHSPSITKFNT